MKLVAAATKRVYATGTREYKTLKGLARAVKRRGGVWLGIVEGELRVSWPRGIFHYKVLEDTEKMLLIDDELWWALRP